MKFKNVINEICKMSAIKATSALSKFLKAPLGVSLLAINKNETTIGEIIDLEDETINLYLPITGNIAGAAFFVFTQKSSLLLCDILFNRKEGITKRIGETEKSAISEVANIVIGNFLSSFSESLQIDYLMHRSAVFERGPFQQTLQKSLLSSTAKLDEAIIKICFSFELIQALCYVFILLEESKINEICENIQLPLKS